MMEEIVLQAQHREVIGKQVKALRREGQLPAIIYGRKVTPIPISLNYREASRVLPGVSSSLLVVVEVDGKRHTTLVRERQRHPVSGSLLHVDFQEVSLTEKIRVTVSVQIRGEAPAVKNFDGILVAGQEAVEIECLPGDLPEFIAIDVSSLENIGNSLHVRDIVLPDTVKILTDVGEMLVVVTAPVVEEEEVVVEEVVAAEPEVIERGKKEEGEEVEE
jgi:large subunit ribosomal protein L25